MSDYYTSRRVRNLFKADSSEPFRLSRSKIDLYLNCQRCFYFDRRLGVGRPPGFPFSLNSAVDKLLKKEFDMHRAKQTSHPLMKAYGVLAVPFQHEKMEEWRDSLRRGITYHDKDTNLVITGGVDDVWINPEGELIIVDYKATSKESEVTLDAEWQIGYKRQMEIYQWLFRMNDFKVSSTGYFVYCNGSTDKEAFDAKLEFNIKLIPYEGNDMWIPGVIEKIHACLMNDSIPEQGEDCDYCKYRNAANDVTREFGSE
ncbi:MAG: PD-(D/E)XK nuclease family protein [bacterium]|nr:PD-(D/E)XK nuclease family protein [bacterium]